MEERMTEHLPRGGRRPGFYVKPKHIGLVFCVSLVGCTVAFGAGFIVGMGYKANEQISPYAVKKPATKVSSREADPIQVTFYDTLFQTQKDPVAMSPAAETPQTPEPVPAAPAPSPQTQPIVAEGTAMASVDQRTAPAETAQTPSPPAAPAPAPIPDRQAPPVVAVAEVTDSAPQAVGPSDTSSLGTDESVVATYSVQVASFLKPERAKRLIEELAEQGYHAYLHPFEAPGQRSWYRVKVGKFADRDTANVALEKLGKPDAMITRD